MAVNGHRHPDPDVRHVPHMESVKSQGGGAGYRIGLGYPPVAVVGEFEWPGADHDAALEAIRVDDPGQAAPRNAGEQCFGIVQTAKHPVRVTIDLGDSREAQHEEVAEALVRRVSVLHDRPRYVPVLHDSPRPERSAADGESFDLDFVCARGELPGEMRQRAGGRSVEDPAIEGELRPVARANEVLLALVEGIGATEVWAGDGERPQRSLVASQEAAKSRIACRVDLAAVGHDESHSRRRVEAHDGALLQL